MIRQAKKSIRRIQNGRVLLACIMAMSAIILLSVMGIN